MAIMFRDTITFNNEAKNLERNYQIALNATFSFWPKGTRFVSNFFLFVMNKPFRI